MRAFLILAFTFGLSTPAHAIPWKGVFVAGDDSIENFDNGRIDLTAAFSALGNLTTLQFSSHKKYYGHDGVLSATGENLRNGFANLNRAEGEGCFIHMTSHGAAAQGFYLSLAGILPPKTLANWVNYACGDAPTIILISACFSGQFITEELKGPNRVILTAARADRPSFGCSADTRYTYWDECVLESIPNSTTWPNLYANVQTCIVGKESALGAQPSEPQAFFGDNTLNWKLVH